VDVRLYTIPGSHPGVAVQLMLRHKGIAFKRTDLFPAISRVIVRRALRFPAGTVPALKIDGQRVHGSREIAHELERLQPEPPLFPADPQKRVAVEEAERFGSGLPFAPQGRSSISRIASTARTTRPFAPLSSLSADCCSGSTT
jgi:glutathione S-transferase